MAQSLYHKTWPSESGYSLHILSVLQDKILDQDCLLDGNGLPDRHTFCKNRNRCGFRGGNHVWRYQKSHALSLCMAVNDGLVLAQLPSGFANHRDSDKLEFVNLLRTRAGLHICPVSYHRRSSSMHHTIHVRHQRNPTSLLSIHRCQAHLSCLETEPRSLF